MSKCVFISDKIFLKRDDHSLPLTGHPLEPGVGIHTDFPHLYIDSIGMDGNGVCSQCGVQFQNQKPSIDVICTVSCL